MTKNDILAAQAAGHIKALMALGNAYEAAPEQAEDFAKLRAKVIALHGGMKAFGLAHHREISPQFGDT